MTFLESLQPTALEGDSRVFCHIWSGGTVSALTYDDLYRGSVRYAMTYRRGGLAPAEIVLIALPHSPDLLYAFFGAMMAGGVPSFLPPPTIKQDPALYWSSHRKLFERVGSGAIVTWRGDADDVRRAVGELPIVIWLREEIAVGDEHDGPLSIERVTGGAAAIAFLQHSSGTTGLKKGVALGFEAVDRQIDAYAAAIGLSAGARNEGVAGDRIVSWLPLYHDMGLIACLILPFVRRVPIVWLDPFEWVARPSMLFEAIAAHSGTLVWLPNFAFHHLARAVRDDSRVDLSGVRAFINCSEPCKAESFELFASRFASWGVTPEQLQVCYAMAEGVFAVTQTPLGQRPRDVRRHDRRLLSVGRPVGDWRVEVVDRDGCSVAEGEIGEIAIAGGSLFSGYHRQPEETARKFRGEWYLTGDLGCLDAGELFVTGRLDDLIIVHGKNLYAHDVEFAVSQVPGVKPGRVVATGLFVADAGTQELVIIAETLDAPEGSVAPAASRTALSRAIKAAVLQHTGLAAHAVHLVEPGWLVKTTSGKISRTENLRKYISSQSGASARNSGTAAREAGLSPVGTS